MKLITGRTLKQYVLALVFDQELENVLMIQKLKPEWQKGKHNGIGGKIEMGESPLRAMKREMAEETGLTIDDFRYVMFLSNENYEMWVYTALADLSKAATKESESVVVRSLNPHDQNYFANFEIIPNLDWMIPYCKYFFSDDNDNILLINKIKSDRILDHEKPKTK